MREGIGPEAVGRELVRLAVKVAGAQGGWLIAAPGVLGPGERLVVAEPEGIAPAGGPQRVFPLEEGGQPLGALHLFWSGPEAGDPDPTVWEPVRRLAVVMLQLMREQQASRRLLHIQEQELCRIVLDIHDGPVQEIFAALSQIQLALQERPRRPPQRHRLEQAARLLEQALAEIRTFIGAFRPPEFEQRPLLAMVHGLILQHEILTGHEVLLEVEGTLPTPPLPVKIALYRLLQEALNNAARYSGVSRYVVRLRGEPGGLWLEVRDEGQGFNPQVFLDERSAEAARHFGLRGMRDRAELLGGRFEIESVPGRGTRVRVWLPC
ncbi:MAG: sensor histidine kinase [Thermoflexus sp.]|uniref:sensor histidine kinase n=1 Tax=Thermoflexus sp. TaxID=1969742 RepID=UPI00331BDFFC